jgi:hypothetical protein
MLAARCGVNAAGLGDSAAGLGDAAAGLGDSAIELATEACGLEAAAALGDEVAALPELQAPTTITRAAPIASGRHPHHCARESILVLLGYVMTWGEALARSADCQQLGVQTGLVAMNCDWNHFEPIGS